MNQRTNGFEDTMQAIIRQAYEMGIRDTPKWRAQQIAPWVLRGVSQLEQCGAGSVNIEALQSEGGTRDPDTTLHTPSTCWGPPGSLGMREKR